VAQAAFQKEDYFRTIEFCQKAIEIDQSQAEYFFLLGKALSENPKWRHDAEKNLRKATELDPSRPEYLAALGELYQSEGLGSRARRTFDKLKALDPKYPIPKR
jgi:tetratricopeptide (TPR) repeat protein